MSHFRKALAAAAMAVTAAGGGLLITGAGAVPAYAATQMPPLGGIPRVTWLPPLPSSVRPRPPAAPA
jgi:hypothetical protein